MLINVTIPIFNEERQLSSSILTLHRFLTENASWRWEIVIANNASTDGSLPIAQKLSLLLPNVKVLTLDMKGRGRAVRSAWLNSQATILTYMDVDLSTNLKAFPDLVDTVAAGRSDLAVGSRLMKTSRTKRGIKREVVSRSYNHLVKAMFKSRFSDAQCGFKAISSNAAHALLPLTENDSWFFDSELLLIAENRGYSIADVPVDWIDDLDSRVNIPLTAFENIQAMVRLKKRLTRGDLSGHQKKGS